MSWTYRPMQLEDVPNLLDWYNDPDLHVTANAKPFQSYTLKELTDYWKDKLGRPKYRYYAILSGNKLIGRVGLKPIRGTASVEYSVMIGESVLHSRGLGTEITRKMIEETFEDPLIESVYLTVREDNKRAIRCYEKCGFRYLGSFVENGVTMLEMSVTRMDVPWAKAN
uniref:N-acetyltransferase n=1 Tax=Cohnella candidum TaxID=2674991 RepID=A0A3G3K6X7_9BACL|nr:GNAT family N-acetyltransferase [Cohnella candidum]AYQ75509.1 N-acetyltransferase [Cohnella candidum]